MRNLLFNISYHGGHYHGYQVQGKLPTITKMLQDAIQTVIGVREEIKGCSRTDAKVHANSYFFSMKTEIPIDCDKMAIALNYALPTDISVNHCVEVPLWFHARYHCTGKEYLYKIWNSNIKQPFLDQLVANHRYYIDVDLLDRAAKEFIGTYDYKAFCSKGSKDIETTRTIHDFTVTRQGDLVIFRVRGDGFLYNMVRIMVGTLLRIEEGTLQIEDIKPIILSKDRLQAGVTARPEGLYLNRVFYGGHDFEGFNSRAE